MAVKIERIVEEDLSLGTGLVDVTMPAGGTAIGHQIGSHSLFAQSFIASMDGGQSITGGAAAAAIQLDTEEQDSVGWYNNATYEFSPTVSGRYHVDGYAQLNTFTGKATLGIYVNGAEVTGVEAVRSNDSARLGVSALLNLAAGDIVTLRMSHNEGTVSRAILDARFSGFLVGRAA